MSQPTPKTETRGGGSSPASCSADLEMAALLVRWKDRILRQAASNIEGHFLNSPVEDFTVEEEGFERGLRTAVDEVCKLMADPSYFGRAPQNAKLTDHRAAGDACSAHVLPSQ